MTAIATTPTAHHLPSPLSRKCIDGTKAIDGGTQSDITKALDETLVSLVIRGGGVSRRPQLAYQLLLLFHCEILP